MPPPRKERKHERKHERKNERIENENGEEKEEEYDLFSLDILSTKSFDSTSTVSNSTAWNSATSSSVSNSSSRSSSSSSSNNNNNNNNNILFDASYFEKEAYNSFEGDTEAEDGRVTKRLEGRSRGVAIDALNNGQPKKGHICTNPLRFESRGTQAALDRDMTILAYKHEYAKALCRSGSR